MVHEAQRIGRGNRESRDVSVRLLNQVERYTARPYRLATMLVLDVLFAPAHDEDMAIRKLGAKTHHDYVQPTLRWRSFCLSPRHGLPPLRWNPRHDDVSAMSP